MIELSQLYKKVNVNVEFSLSFETRTVLPPRDFYPQDSGFLLISGFLDITQDDILKSCGQMMFNTTMFTNVKDGYEWVNNEDACIGIF